MPLLEGIFMMTDFTLLVSRNERVTRLSTSTRYSARISKELPQRTHRLSQRPTRKNWRSSTIRPVQPVTRKGVMLPYRSLWSTPDSLSVLPLKTGDKLLCMLPMAHMYGLAFRVPVNEFSVGCYIYYLTRMPSPGRSSSRHSQEVKPNSSCSRSAHYRKDYQEEYCPNWKRRP